MASDGEGPPKSYLPERTKGDGQVNLHVTDPSFCNVSRDFVALFEDCPLLS